ncbi:MAG: hypothetical protein IIB81_05130 [Nanoarchaeota archaeon]|nr:hypothetical protein [Nanoarchaeota archaeon]
MKIIKFLLILLLTGCATAPGGFITPVDKSRGLLKDPGITIYKPQENREDIKRISGNWWGCAKISKIDGLRIVKMYYLKGDIEVRLHEYDHYLYGFEHVRPIIFKGETR